MGRATTCIVNNANIVRQMAFPLELLPLKTLASPIVFFLVSLLAMIAYAGWITRGTILPVYAWGIPVLLLISITMFTAGLILDSVSRARTEQLRLHYMATGRRAAREAVVEKPAVPQLRAHRRGPDAA